MILDILPLLAAHKVEVILIGGVAAMVHGSQRSTVDIDFVYHRTEGNIQKLAAALSDIEPYLRDAPRGLPFRWDAATIKAGLNFTLMTSLGDLDLFAEVPGGGTDENLLPSTVETQVAGFRVLCVTLEKLIDLKLAAGRHKDLTVAAELQVLLEEKRKLAD